MRWQSFLYGGFLWVRLSHFSLHNEPWEAEHRPRTVHRRRTEHTHSTEHRHRTEHRLRTEHRRRTQTQDRTQKQNTDRGQTDGRKTDRQTHTHIPNRIGCISRGYSWPLQTPADPWGGTFGGTCNCMMNIRSVKSQWDRTWDGFHGCIRYFNPSLSITITVIFYLDYIIQNSSPTEHRQDHQVGYMFHTRRSCFLSWTLEWKSHIERRSSVIYNPNPINR